LEVRHEARGARHEALALPDPAAYLRHSWA